MHIKIIIGLTLLTTAICLAVPPQVQTWREELLLDRETLLERWMKEVSGHSEPELINLVKDVKASEALRMAGAILLIKHHHSEEGWRAAVHVAWLYLAPRINDWDEDFSLLSYPVAYAAAQRDELIPLIVEEAIMGDFPPLAANEIFVTLQQQRKLHLIDLSRVKPTKKDPTQQTRYNELAAFVAGTTTHPFSNPYTERPVHSKPRPVLLYAEAKALARLIAEPDISSERRRQAIEELGEIKTEFALKELIALITTEAEQQTSNDSTPPAEQYPVIQALKNAGPIAIPHLVNRICAIATNPDGHQGDEAQLLCIATLSIARNDNIQSYLTALAAKEPTRAVIIKNASALLESFASKTRSTEDK